MIQQENLRPKQAAAWLSVSLPTFWRMVSDKKIPTFKVGRRVTLVKRADLERYLAKGSNA